MSQKILLDSGLIVAFCSKNPPKKISKLFEKISEKQFHAMVVKFQISEIAFHLCKLYNKETTQQLIYSVIDKYNIQLLDPSTDLLVDVGLFRKNYPKILSYVDCIMLLLCNQEKIIFHTTEKRLKNLLSVDLINKVKIVQYAFD